MEVGQIMMQMSTGVASTGSAPASAEMATVPAGESSDSVFAGMMREMTPLIPGKSAVSADAATNGMKVTPDSSGAAKVLKPTDMNIVVGMLCGMSSLISGTAAVVPDAEAKGKVITPDSDGESTDSKPADANTDIMAALLAVIGTQDQMPTADANDTEGKPEEPVESSQPEALMPQDVALFAAGSKLALSAGDNGRMPESGQKVEQQDDDGALPQRSVRLVGEVVMHAQQGRSVELSQGVTSADPTFSGETTAGKTDTTGCPVIVATEGGLDLLGSIIPVDTCSVSAKEGMSARTAEVIPVVKHSVEAKPQQPVTVANGSNGLVVNEVLAATGNSHEISSNQADVNSLPVAENIPEQMDVPADARIRASEFVHPNTAIGVQEAGGKKMESQKDGNQVHLDTAATKKNLESVSADFTKVSPVSTVEKELLNEGGNDTADHGVNGQFYQPATHQQVKADLGTSLAGTSSTDQKDMSHSDMSENVFRQVKNVLVNREVKAGSEQITMKLSPEHLGELTLNFKMENQQLKVEIIAANRDVRDALMQHAENLKESLARQNITMESFDVLTSGGQRGFEQNDRGWKQLAQQQFMAGTSSGGYRYRTPEVEAVAMPQYGIQKQYAMVDVHY